MSTGAIGRLPISATTGMEAATKLAACTSGCVRNVVSTLISSWL
ncbi:MAG: hypothetical protein ABSH30_13650 [Acidimicrobiales bacterium]|jgi:hypothetical protein